MRPDVTDAEQPRATIVVPAEVAATLALLVGAVGPAVVLVGGWAVVCRLRMARSATPPTVDLDVLLRADARPARAALAAIEAVQSDPRHSCRLDGLPLLVDLLADGPSASLAVGHRGRGDGEIEDEDGLRLLIPPFAALLTRTAEPMRLADENGDAEAVVRLPRAGALLAAKIANITLELRQPEKRASDGEHAVRLIEAFGSTALCADLTEATPDERADLHHHLEQIGAGGLDGQSRAAGFPRDRARLEVVVDDLLRGLVNS